MFAQIRSYHPGNHQPCSRERWPVEAYKQRICNLPTSFVKSKNGKAIRKVWTPPDPDLPGPTTDSPSLPKNLILFAFLKVLKIFNPTSFEQKQLPGCLAQLTNQLLSKLIK